jgi:amidohydrolase
MKRVRKQMESGSLLEEARALQDTLAALRRRIHQHPELGFQEVETSKLVAETLATMGLEVQTAVAKTGVVGQLGEDGPMVALRADMDALPISEASGVPYTSRVPGVMHACGHDAHTAMLLGAAMLLSRRNMPGRVRFLFQPCEEGTDAEGKSGAMRMVDEGAMRGVEAVIALHVDPRVDTGQITVGEGPICAAADSFAATIVGVGCHGAFPHLGIDPVFISAQVIMAIQGIVSRRVDPTRAAVVTVGSIRGGTASNVIPPEVQLKGTIRSLSEDVRRQLWDELRKCLQLTRALGGDFRLDIQGGFPVLSNDAKMASLIRQVASEMLGEDNVRPQTVEMGAEDFAILAEQAPGAMFMLGVKRVSAETALQLHSPDFDIDEAALPIGAAILAGTAHRYLASASE